MEISIFLGFFAGYVVANVFSRLITIRAEKQAIMMAQLQALRLFSQSVLHYGHLRQWHDNVAIGLDDIKTRLAKNMTDGILTPEGKVSFTTQEIEEISDFWNSQYEQELKSLWNTFEWDMKNFKDNSVALIAASSANYGTPPYQNWQQAMQWLAHFELALLREAKEKENNNSEETK